MYNKLAEKSLITFNLERIEKQKKYYFTLAFVLVLESFYNTMFAYILMLNFYLLKLKRIQNWGNLKLIHERCRSR